MKGMEALKEADVIVYDHLASPSLLNATKDEAEWIDAGKFAGHHRMKQAEIEELLIEKAMDCLLYTSLKSLGIEGDYEGIGHCVLGYTDGEEPKAMPRKENYVYCVK